MRMTPITFTNPDARLRAPGVRVRPFGGVGATLVETGVDVHRRPMVE
jgi:hypothetical protein